MRPYTKRRDSAGTYEQRRWEYAIASYVRWKPFLVSGSPAAAGRAQRRIDSLLKDYPQLAKHG